MADTATADRQAPPVPVKGGAVPYLMVDGALKAAQFYEKAFGAEIKFFYPPDEQGRTMHVHLYVNGSSVMLSDAYPEHGVALEKPQGFNIALMFDEGIDERFQRAVDAGCAAVMPPTDMFWGDRYGQVRDPFGVLWAMNQGK
jgi:uncharacterized glyoxalase superfamily protein PhnB